MKNIILTGFMGTGKTSTGKVLAQRLGRAFIDLDQKIEETYGQSIPSMFAERGEAYFRACEKQVVAEVAARANAVISTGGGTVKDPENVARLREHGIIVCLTASPEEILVRTARRGSRPVLDRRADALEDGGQGERLSAIEGLLKERAALYSQADLTVDTDDSSPLQTVERIIHALKARGELRT